MAYSDDAVKSKLSALTETQDSIVTVAQWIMFHKRHAGRTAGLWFNRLQENHSTSKRLNLVYLANEVVQQSRARGKQDFQIAFEPLIADATATAYQGASQEIRGKLRRVVEVWRVRQIFDARVQEQIEQKLAEQDKLKGGKSLGGGGARLGGSLFGGGVGSVAPELEQLNKVQTTLSKAEAASKGPVNTANAEHTKMTDPTAPIPSAPVRAAKLRGVVTALRTAHGAVDASIKARKELISCLEKLVTNHHAAEAEEEATRAELSTKIDSMETVIRDVEDSIMRGQEAPATSGASNGDTWAAADPERPETEGFTPPPPDIESFTPPPQQEDAAAGSNEVSNQDITLLPNQGLASTTGADLNVEQPSIMNEPDRSYVPPSALPHQDVAAQAQDFLQSLIAAGQVRHASGEIPASATGDNPGDPRLKRRKMSHNVSNNIDDEFFGANNVGGVDEDGISAMLGQ